MNRFQNNCKTQRKSAEHLLRVIWLMTPRSISIILASFITLITGCETVDPHTQALRIWEQEYQQHRNNVARTGSFNVPRNHLWKAMYAEMNARGTVTQALEDSGMVGTSWRPEGNGESRWEARIVGQTMPFQLAATRQIKEIETETLYKETAQGLVPKEVRNESVSDDQDGVNSFYVSVYERVNGPIPPHRPRPMNGSGAGTVGNYQVVSTPAPPAGQRKSAIPVSGRPNLVVSPYAPQGPYIDTAGIPSGTPIECPTTRQSILVP